MFQSAGERLNAIISFVLMRVKRSLGCRNQKVSAFELIAVEFGMTTMLILGGSLIFCEQEKWTYFESIYYSFVTFWTIGNYRKKNKKKFSFTLFFFIQLGFGDFVPLANVQRTGQSLYSRWAYFIFTVSFILFGLAIMASTLNLLVLRLAQFHSQSGTSGISALIGRKEEELIAEAIAHHRASIHMLQRNRICSNTNLDCQQKTLQTYTFARQPSLYSLTSTSSSSSDSKDRHCCSNWICFKSQKRKKRYWRLRRSPQNIKHLLYVDQFMNKNHQFTIPKRVHLPLQNCHSDQIQEHLSNHLALRQHRISI